MSQACRVKLDEGSCSQLLQQPVLAAGRHKACLSADMRLPECEGKQLKRAPCLLQSGIPAVGRGSLRCTTACAGCETLLLADTMAAARHNVAPLVQVRRASHTSCTLMRMGTQTMEMSTCVYRSSGACALSLDACCTQQNTAVWVIAGATCAADGPQSMLPGGCTPDSAI